MLLLVGCSRQGNAEAQKNLSGRWTAAGDNSESSHFKSTVTVDPNGDYVCEVIFQSSWDGVTRTSNLAGRWEVRDGVLIDTITKHSQTNAILPMISSARIVRLDGRQLVLTYGSSNQGAFPTNEIVFRKEQR
jgi:hypothetical protein